MPHLEIVNAMKHRVPFISVESCLDLLVSFPLDQHAESSLTLLRTPKYEVLLADEERGVSVGTGLEGSMEREFLVAVDWSSFVVNAYDHETVRAGYQRRRGA